MSRKVVGMLSGKCLSLFAGIAAGALVCASAPAQTTQPSADAAVTSTAQLQLRANELLTKSDYANALPLLEKVAQGLSDQPDQLGPVLEEIRVCRKQIKLAAATPAPSPSGQATAPVRVALATPVPANGPPTAEDRKPHPLPVAGQTVDLAIKDLGNFEYDAEKGGGIPDDVKKLDGCHIRTHGFMIPLDQAESIAEFALVPSLFACCFGQPPQIQHTLVVHCPKGKAVSYYPDEIIVEGKLKVDEKKDDGYIISVFEIDASSVKPAPK
jgi:hypothetical protein